MANDYIPVTLSVTKPHPQLLLSFKDAVKQVLMQGPILLDIMNHSFESNPLDFSGLETRFGLPTGTGQTVFDQINGTMGVLLGTMQNDQAVNLVSRVG